MHRYQGYDPEFQFNSSAPSVIGWSAPEDLGNGYIAPSNASNSDIICHKGATPGRISAPVKAGGNISLTWNEWPESHHGPVLNYLANCNGSCQTVDKTALKFFKINESGLLNDDIKPGLWGTDLLIKNNFTWNLRMPDDIKPGNYVLRHEIIALHLAASLDGAQLYPQCVNLVVGGSGTKSPNGTSGQVLYKEHDPGILFDIYESLTTGYPIPGPTPYTGVSSSTNFRTATSAPMYTTSAIMNSRHVLDLDGLPKGALPRSSNHTVNENGTHQGEHGGSGRRKRPSKGHHHRPNATVSSTTSSNGS